MNEEQHASFSKSSSLGSGLQPSHERDNQKQQAAKIYVVGGYTCCVPGCFSNSKEISALHFTRFQMARARKNRCCEKVDSYDMLKGY